MYIDPSTNTKMEYMHSGLNSGTALYPLGFTARLYLGGSTTSTFPNKGCDCTIKSMIFYRDLFTTDMSLMDGFSGYNNGIFPENNNFIC